MATVATKAPASLDSAQRAWLKKMGVALDAPVADVPKTNGAVSALKDQEAAREGAEKKAFVPELLTFGPAVLEIIKKLGGGRRICAVKVVNKTDRVLHRGVAKHESGDFAKLPPDTIKPGETGEFVTSSPEPIPIIDVPTEGAIGELPWLLDGDTSWFIEWRNPVAGKNKGKTRVAGLNAAKFAPDMLFGNGNTAEYRFTLTGGGTPPGPQPPGPGPTPPPGPAPSGVDAASSCHVTITNDTKLALTLGGQGHERGDFMTFPAKTLAPGASTSFVSVETPNSKDPKDEGCKGFVLWQVGSPAVLWRVEWDNPEQAKNSVTAAFNPPNAGFLSLNQIGQGEENVPVAFTISGGGGGVQPPASTGKLTMTVIEEAGGKAIKDATVDIAGKSVKTADTGKAEFTLPPGSHPFRVTAESFEEQSGKVDVADGKDTEFTVKLKKSEPEPEFKPPVESKQPTFRRGDKSADGWVEYLQSLLRDHHAIAPNLTIDGNFGPGTEKAVRAFQTKNGLLVDGVVGNQTWAALRKGAPEKPSTDGRKPHTFVEKGREARWDTERDNPAYITDSDEFFMFATSVGEERIDGAEVTMRITPPNTKPKVIKVLLGKPDQEKTTGVTTYTLTLKDFKKKFPATDPQAKIEDYLVEAFFAQELGGDLFKGNIIV